MFSILFILSFSKQLQIQGLFILGDVGEEKSGDKSDLINGISKIFLNQSWFNMNFGTAFTEESV